MRTAIEPQLEFARRRGWIDRLDPQVQVRGLALETQPHIPAEQPA